MFTNLPDELIYKIVNKLNKQHIYYLTLTSKYLNSMKFQAILTSLMFKEYFDLTYEELLDMKNYSYKLGDYLNDFYEINTYNMYNYETKKIKYINKKMYKFDHNQVDLFEKKELTNVKIHPIYRIPLLSYTILKMKKSPILALIY